MIAALSRNWILRPPVPDEIIGRFAGLSPLLVQLLFNRGVVAPEDAETFLADQPPRTANPLLMRGVDGAVARLAIAAKSAEPVVVYGDYDVDGITAAAVLAEGLTAVGITPAVHIPSRADGYGLSRGALAKLSEQGVRLVITVDCGVNSAAEVAFARERGIDVIVTDHHRIDGPLPDAVAVVNPRQEGCQYPFKELAAVGVALKVAQATLERLPLHNGLTRRGVAGQLLDLVALGTVADVAPLVGENRSLVRHGLVALNATPRVGLRALIAKAGLRMGAITAGSVGYALGPRLNAAGRVDDAQVAYRLLVARDEAEAGPLARELEAVNQRRQRIMGEALAVARAKVVAAESAKLLFVADPALPSGVVGLIAGRLVEEFHRPAVVVEQTETECRGSARSVDGFNIAEALAGCRDILTRFGGHAAAAGLTVPSENLPILRERLVALAEERLDSTQLRPRLMVDAAVSLRALDDGVHDQIARLAPFGVGNPTPLFLSRGVQVISARVVGRDEPAHLKLQLHDGERHWPAIAFRMGHLASQVAGRIDIVYTLVRNDWEGRLALELQVKDWRPAT